MTTDIDIDRRLQPTENLKYDQKRGLKRLKVQTDCERLRAKFQKLFGWIEYQRWALSKPSKITFSI